MIQAVYYRGYNRLTVTGHARSAEPGHDLVCASASILAYTLAANVKGLENGGQVRQAVIRTESGDAEISCRPRHNMKHVVTLVFDTVCEGFALLAKDYPEYISFEIRL